MSVSRVAAPLIDDRPEHAALEAVLQRWCEAVAPRRTPKRAGDEPGREACGAAPARSASLYPLSRGEEVELLQRLVARLECNATAAASLSGGRTGLADVSDSLAEMH